VARLHREFVADSGHLHRTLRIVVDDDDDEAFRLRDAYALAGVFADGADDGLRRRNRRDYRRGCGTERPSS
jgi:hypothetical protein